MKITKNLKYATFEWDDQDKTFTVTDKDENVVVLNKVYSFAFMRFVVRMAQRNWFRKIKDKTTSEPKENPVELAEHPWEDPDQMMLEMRDAKSNYDLDKLPF